MIGLLLVGAALAGPYVGRNADVTAERTIAAPPEVVFAQLSDLPTLQKLYPADCADWGGPFDGEGVGAKTIVTYTAGAMMRRLDAVVKDEQPGRVLDLDHPGNKGFVTRFELADQGGSTRVKMTTYIEAPPKLVRRYYFEEVQPAWQGCHERTLANLDAAATASPP